MRLTQKTQTSVFVWIVLVLLISSNIYCYTEEINVKYKDTSEYSSLFPIHKYKLKSYELNSQQVLEEKNVDSIILFKKLAFSYAKANKAKLACQYIEKYIQTSLDVSFVKHSNFDPIHDSDSYIRLVDKYHQKFDFWWLFCLYVGFIGVFISIVLNFRRCTDRIANLLMSVFLFQHSAFIINISLLPTNYEFYFPHSLYLSTLFSFLYGPLIYFYFKRVVLKYRFKPIDLLHLIPTLFLLLLLLPVYNLSGEEKLWVMLNDKRPYITLISDAKLLSLLIYMILVIRIYIKSVKNDMTISKIQYHWHRNIIILCSLHIISYVFYDILMIRRIADDFPINFQILSIALLILYISYTAFVEPGVFSGLKMIKNEVHKGLNNELKKYKKSGLTEQLSLELKEKLLELLEKDKIYRRNDMSLQKLSGLLNTSRHNTSQIINEHFNLNFFELINKYRIEEAKKILKDKQYQYENFNIIDVAYEVGFNNKVTFNKSFKKYNRITPSEYVKS